MLQKYHPNPLSHFLALHNSQATHHNVVDAHTLASTLANGHVQFQQHHHHHQQHQPQLPNPALLANHHHSQNTHNQQTALELAAQHLNSPTHAIQRDHHSPLSNQLLQQQRNSQHQIQNHYHHHHQQHHHHAQQLIEAAAAANTTLDAGKSFTIAAILGLQKSAMENTRKEYTNNVINLSLNGTNNHHHHHHNNNNSNTQEQLPPTSNNNTTPPLNEEDELNHHQQQHHHHHPQQPQQIQRDSLKNSNNNNHNNNNNNNNSCSINNDFNSNNNNNSNCNSHNIREVTKSNICNSFINTCNTSTNVDGGSNCNVNTNGPLNNPVNSFNCDNTTTNTTASAVTAATVLMNRYLPSAMANVTGSNVVASTPSLASFASSPVMTHQQHARANSFVAAAAAAAAAAAVNGAPSALQSLQQLHQQHAHQTSLNFQREKLKSDHNGKKTSLKNKRVRTIFTPEQLERLEAEFERQQYMVGPERLYLAHTLSLTEAQVKVWFQNRRIKWRKHHLEMTQQRLALLRQTQIATNPNSNNEPATINIDTNDDECDDIKREELRESNESRQDTESELSICNDSMDVESIIDGDDET